MIPKVPYPFGSDPYTQWVAISDRLLRERIISLAQELDDETANQIIALMLHLNAEDSTQDIRLQINSAGGSLTAALALIDTMQQLSCDVVTVCVGLAASVSALVLACGTKGKRFALPHARIKLHHPNMRTIQGKATDIEIEAREALYLRRQLNEIYAQRTGQPLEKIEKDTDRGLFLSAQEALEYGLVDQVIQTK